MRVRFMVTVGEGGGGVLEKVWRWFTGVEKGE